MERDTKLMSTRPRGRPRKHVDNAARCRAYRQRLHQARTLPHVVRWLEDLVSQGATFGTVYVDPPWSYDNRRTRGAATDHYQTMSTAEIAALPVSKLVAPSAHLHLWTTTSHLFECPAILEAWGFTYKSQLIWCKPMGLGNYWRVSHEILLLGVKGKAPFRHHALKSWLVCARGPHSNKPEEVRHFIEQASPGPYLELFGRRPTPGWTVFGDQIERNLFES
jgi:N6-adenosine-specific RNA methylase IME4